MRENNKTIIIFLFIITSFVNKHRATQKINQEDEVSAV